MMISSKAQVLHLVFLPFTILHTMEGNYDEITKTMRATTKTLVVKVYRGFYYPVRWEI